MTTAPRSEGEPTTMELLSGVAVSARDLLVAHGAQLHAEIASEIIRRERVAGWIGAGFALFLTGVGFAIVGFEALLTEQYGWSHTASWFTVGGIVAAIGGVIWAVARERWRSMRFAPETWQSMRESLSWITNPR